MPIVNLALNDKEYFVGKIKNGQASGLRDICQYVDLCWTSAEDALVKYCVEGSIPIYLLEGANPDIHKPDIDLFGNPQKRDITVSFVGQCYGTRSIIVKKLQRDGIDIVAYGSGWENVFSQPYQPWFWWC